MTSGARQHRALVASCQARAGQVLEGVAEAAGTVWRRTWAWGDGRLA
jgi:hypothetical protein